MSQFYGDKSNGIFCRIGCSSNRTLQENLLEFVTPKDALLEGYVPCDHCRPMLSKEESGDLELFFQLIYENLKGKYSDFSLQQQDIHPGKIRTWFQKHHHMTHQDFLRLLRVNLRFGPVMYDDNTGKCRATRTAENGTIVISRMRTPIGPFLLAATEAGICMVEFAERRMLETQLSRLEKYFGATLVSGTSPYFGQLATEMGEYFAASRTEFSVSLDIRGTPFQETVWQELLKIPYGKTRYYEEQAIAIGNSGAVRAVARANGDNRIAVLVPCHRVIGKDGSMTGYGGKIWRKEYLLKLEGANILSGQLALGYF